MMVVVVLVVVVSFVVVDFHFVQATYSVRGSNALERLHSSVVMSYP